MPVKRRSWVVCIRNEGYEASLERRKIYEALPDADAEAHNQLRVIDESGDDYLFRRGTLRRLSYLPRFDARWLPDKPLQPMCGACDEQAGREGS
jgi:hypothetical protein